MFSSVLWVVGAGLGVVFEGRMLCATLGFMPLNMLFQGKAAARSGSQRASFSDMFNYAAWVVAAIVAANDQPGNSGAKPFFNGVYILIAMTSMLLTARVWLKPLGTKTHSSICVGCGYSLHGLSSEGRCPECGHPFNLELQQRDHVSH